MITFKKNLEGNCFPCLHGNGYRRISDTFHTVEMISGSYPDLVQLGVLSGLWRANNMIWISPEQRHGNTGTSETQVSSLYGPSEGPNGATPDGKSHPGRDQIELEHMSCTVRGREGRGPSAQNPAHKHRLPNLASMRISPENTYFGSDVQPSQDAS